MNPSMLHLEKTLTGHTAAVTGLAAGPDGRLLSGSMDRTVRLWDVDKKFEAMQIDHIDPVFAVAFDPNGRWLVSGCTDNAVRLYKRGTGTEVALMKNGGGSAICSLAFRPDGLWLAAASTGGRVGLWEVPSGSERGTIPPGDELTLASYDAVAFSPDGGRLAAGRSDGRIELWESGAGRLVARLPGHSCGDATVGLKQLLFSPDGRCLASAAGIRESTVRVWSLPGEDGEPVRELAGFSEYSTSMAFSPDGRFLATAPDGVVKIRECDGWRELAALPGHSAGINSLTWSQAGWLASGGEDCSIIIWSKAG